MLQSIRDNTRITSTIIGLLVIIFALWGINGYLGFSTKKENNIVAKVAGQTLLKGDFDRAYQQVRDRLGAGFSNDEKLVKQLKQQTLEQWEEMQVLTQAALQSKYRVSQESMDSALLSIPAFQSSGHFSAQSFYGALKSMNYTKFQFLAGLQQSLLINQVQQGITQSAFVLPEEINQFTKLMHQKRDFAYLIIPYSKFLAMKLPTVDSQALAYYQQHKQDFLQAEQISLEYVELSLAKGESKQAFVEASAKLANLAYMYPDSLDRVAKTLDLAINSTPYFERKGGKEALTKDPKVIAAAFSPDVLQGNNSAVISVGTDSVIVLRVKGHKPSVVQPYRTVREKILNVLNKKMAIAKAQEVGEGLLKELAKTSHPSAVAKYHLKWKYTKQAARSSKQGDEDPLLSAAFKLTPSNKSTQASSSLVGFGLVNGDYALVRLIAVYEGDIKSTAVTELTSVTNKKSDAEELAENFGQLDYRLYKQGLLKKAKLVQY